MVSPGFFPSYLQMRGQKSRQQASHTKRRMQSRTMLSLSTKSKQPSTKNCMQPQNTILDMLVSMRPVKSDHILLYAIIYLCMALQNRNLVPSTYNSSSADLMARKHKMFMMRLDLYTVYEADRKQIQGGLCSWKDSMLSVMLFLSVATSLPSRKEKNLRKKGLSLMVLTTLTLLMKY